MGKITVHTFRDIGQLDLNRYAQHQFMDEDIHSGNSYYKLKIIDEEGNISYSQIKSVMRSDKSEDQIMIFPNPTHNKLEVKISDNETAENYNPNVNTDDGSCVIIGCMNQESDNYNPEANIQDDSCIFYGCINETAENYNSQANTDAGTCIIYGCILDIFPNYNPEATIDDLSCSFDGLDIYGCTDQTALNYNPQANMDNGSCIYQDSLEDCGSQIQEESIPLYLPGGWTIFGYTCIEPVDAILGFSNVIEQVVIVKDSEGNAYLPDYFFNGIGDLIYSRGYQIKTTEEILGFSFCTSLIVTENTPQREVGDLAEGGIVFYVDETGEHGLVAALEDLTDGATDPYENGFNGYEWGCFQDSVNGADGTSIGTGYQNTLDIVAVS